MSRFFVNPDSVDRQSGLITITGEDVKHIGNVLRASPGDALELSDGAGVDYVVVIEHISKDGIAAKIMSEKPNSTEPPVEITLFQGLPKADKMDLIIQKCIELGVNRIVPVVTDRTVVKLDAKDAAAKTARWRRIALEAAKQCNRGIVPSVEEPVKLDKALKAAEGFDLKLLPYEQESHGSLRRHLQQYTAKRIAVFIGPEGGFSAEEVEKAVRGGFQSVTLGPRILRTETAGMAVISIIMYEIGDMGN